MQLGSGSGTIIVRQRPRGLIWAVPCAAIFLLAIVAGVAAQPNTSGKITAAVFFGIFLLAIVGAWLSVNRRRARLEIESGSISYWISKRSSPSFTLRRGPDSALRLIPAQRGKGVTADARLTLAGPALDGTRLDGAGADDPGVDDPGVDDTAEIILFGFSVPAVIRGCEAAGWRFR